MTAATQETLDQLPTEQLYAHEVEHTHDVDHSQPATEHVDLHAESAHHHHIEQKPGHTCAADCPEHGSHDQHDHHHGHYESHDHKAHHIGLKSHSCGADCPEHHHGHNHAAESKHDHHHSIETKPHACGADCHEHHQQTHHSHEHSHGLTQHTIEPRHHACHADCPEHGAGAGAEQARETQAAIIERQAHETQHSTNEIQKNALINVPEVDMMSAINKDVSIEESQPVSRLDEQHHAKLNPGTAEITDSLPMLGAVTTDVVSEAVVQATSMETVELTHASSTIQRHEAETPLTTALETVAEHPSAQIDRELSERATATEMAVVETGEKTVLATQDLVVQPSQECESIQPVIAAPETTALLQYSAGDVLQENHATLMTGDVADSPYEPPQAEELSSFDAAFTTAKNSLRIMETDFDTAEKISLGSDPILQMIEQILASQAQFERPVHETSDKLLPSQDALQTLEQLLGELGFEDPSRALAGYIHDYGLNFVDALTDQLFELRRQGYREQQMRVSRAAATDDSAHTMRGRLGALIVRLMMARQSLPAVA